MTNLIGAFEALIDFDEIWWSICKAMMNIIHLLEQAFTFVVGGSSAFIDAEGETQNANNLLTNIFSELFGAEGSMSGVYWGMVLACMALMIIFTFIGVLRAQFTKDVTESIRKMVGKGFWSMIKMLFVPIFFFIALIMVGAIFDFLLECMGGNSENGLAEVICKCFTESEYIEWNSAYSGDAKIDLQAGKFDYLLCILTSGFLIVTLVTATIAVTKRFVKIFFYYITAPMVLSKSMIDEGKSWELWKDNLLSQLLGAGGVIISMYLFVRIVPTITDAIDTGVSNLAVKSILKIVFIAGMSTVPAGATALMAQLISQGSGQNESNDLMHTQQMLGNGLRVAGAAVGRAISGGLSAMSRTGSSMMGQMMMGAAGGLTPTSPTGGGSGGSPVVSSAMNLARGAGTAMMGGAGGSGGSGGSSSGKPSQASSTLATMANRNNSVNFGAGEGIADSPAGTAIVDSKQSGLTAGGEAPIAANGEFENTSGLHIRPNGGLGSNISNNDTLNLGNIGSPSHVNGVNGSSAQAVGIGGVEPLSTTQNLNPSENGGEAIISGKNGRESHWTDNVGRSNNEALRSSQEPRLDSTERGTSMISRIKASEAYQIQKRSAQAHSGGLGFAMMRGGLAGGAMYAGVRTASRVALLGKSAIKSAAKGAGKLIGKIPTKNGGTLGDSLAQFSQNRRAKATLESQRRQSNKQQNEQTQQATREMRANMNFERLRGEDVENNPGEGLRKYFDERLQALNSKAVKVEATLGKDKYKNLTDEQKNAYRTQLLGGEVNRLKRQMDATRYGRTDAMRQRFLQASSGTLNNQQANTSGANVEEANAGGNK